MQKSNLVILLKRFSKRDWRECRKFVQSPYFNQRADVTQLFVILEESIKSGVAKQLDPERISQSLYPSSAFDEKRLRHTTSVLLKLVKKYLVQTRFEEAPMLQQQYLVEALRAFDVSVFFEKELAAANVLLENENLRNSEFYFQRYKVDLEEMRYIMSQRRTGEMNFQKVADQLTIFYLSGMLRLCCTIQSHRTLSAQGYDLKLLKQVLDFIADGGFADIPAVTLYYHGYKAIEYLEQHAAGQSEQHFQQLKKQIEEHWQLLPSSETEDLYLLGINYCIRRMNAGERLFVREAFELFRSALVKEVLLEKGYISSFSYKNITRLGIALSENDWVKQFIEDYKKHLHPRERENTWRYNLAYFYFQQQNYKSAMPLLLQVELKDVLNNLDARRMLLKSYFELGEYNALDSLLDAFAGYLRRQKDIGYHRENNLNLIRFVRRMIQSGFDKKEMEQLREEMKETRGLAERDWLMEKMGEKL